MTKETPDSYWNYRVMKRWTAEGYTSSIHEVYYRCGRIRGWTQEPVVLDHLDDFIGTMEKILRGAKELPPLDYYTGKELPNDDSE